MVDSCHINFVMASIRWSASSLESAGYAHVEAAVIDHHGLREK